MALDRSVMGLPAHIAGKTNGIRNYTKMLAFLKRRLTRPSVDADIVKFLADLATQRLFILSLNANGNFTGDKNNTAEVIAWMEQNAQETAAGRPLNIYSFEESGQLVTPFFSSSENVGTFIESDPTHKWKAFTNAGIIGMTLFKYLSQAASSGSKIVLNPRTDEERTISPDVLQTIINQK